MEQAATNKFIDQNNQKVVLTIKYKIYIVLLILLMLVTRGMMKKAQAAHEAVRTNIVTLENQKLQTETEYQQVIKDLLVIKEINTQKTTISACLTTRGCNSLPDSIKSVVPQTRAFLLLQKNAGAKMAYDQKKILANINEFLLRGANNQPNGTVTSIVFGNLADVEGVENVIQVPITLTVDFADKNGLLSFVYNVENTISTQFPMLYTINSVNYDIVKYQETQTVTIDIIGYMTK